MDARINTVNETIKTEDSIRLRLNNSLVENTSEIKKNNETILEKKSYIVKIENEIEIEKNWKLYLKMIGKDGISKMVLRNSLPIINSEINRLLTGVADFEVQVEINDKGDVNFIMSRNGVKYNLSAASGLEKTQAALALRVVLGNMSSLCNVSFVLLDEVLGGVAECNYDDMKKLYESGHNILTKKHKSMNNVLILAESTKNICDYMTRHKNDSVTESVDPDKLIKEFKERLKDTLTEAEMSFVQQITDWRSPIAEQRKEKLFNKFKNECISKVDEMLKEDSGNVELESLKKQLEEQKFNKDSIVQDIAKLLEIRDILLDK
jgi:hypothetical protein